MRTTTWKFIINEENKPVLAFTNRSYLTCDCCKNPRPKRKVYDL